MPCVECNNEIPPNKAKWNAKYCSKQCEKTAYKRKYSPAPKVLCSASALGASSEHLVCADLLLRGYWVFRSVTPDAPFDLLAHAEGKSIRVEVKTTRKSEAGKIYTPRTKVGAFDVLAMCFADGSVEYRPAL